MRDGKALRRHDKKSTAGIWKRCAKNRTDQNRDGNAASGGERIRTETDKQGEAFICSEMAMIRLAEK